ARRRPGPIYTIVPYTTLFRSIRKNLNRAMIQRVSLVILAGLLMPSAALAQSGITNQNLFDTEPFLPDLYARRVASFEQEPVVTRSEEHTSELQSRENLVCRLL